MVVSKPVPFLCIALVVAAMTPALAGDELPVDELAEPAAEAPPQPEPEPPADPEPDVAPPTVSPVSVHGFVSEAAYVSTANDFLGNSSRGSLRFFEAAINVVADYGKLRGGVQLFTQEQGASDSNPRLDWAFLDYQARPWLGVRAGRVRIPFGLFNDYLDIDAARLHVLLPQSVYPLGNRQVLTAQTGISLYGTARLGGLGDLDYQVYGGALSLPYTNVGAAFARIYRNTSDGVIGGQAFWRPPVEGLRVGGSWLLGLLEQHAVLAPTYVDMLIAAGLAPPGYDGDLELRLDPARLWVASAEYTRGPWTFAAEYSRWWLRTLVEPKVLAVPHSHSERAYAMASYQATERLAVGAYLSVMFDDVHDRAGDGLPEPYLGRSRDASLAARYDLDEHWLMKLEAHVIDGTAGFELPATPELPERIWGLFLLRTTLTF